MLFVGIISAVLIPESRGKGRFMIVSVLERRGIGKEGAVFSFCLDTLVSGMEVKNVPFTASSVSLGEAKGTP